MVSLRYLGVLAAAVLVAAVTGFAVGRLTMDDTGPGTSSAQDNPYIVAMPDPEAHPVPRDDPGPADTTVAIELGEWYLDADTAEVNAGVVEFRIANDGARVHEFVIVQDGVELDEVENILPGEVRIMKFAFEPGSYELVCLLRERKQDGTIEDHRELGMRTAFEVR
ncbi:MAG: hypothetical protein Kow0010_00090 [Dehalococcoidia bacterium]